MKMSAKTQPTLDALRVQARFLGDVPEFAAAEVLEEGALLRLVVGDEEVVEAVAVHVAEGAAQAMAVFQPMPESLMMSVKVPSRLLRKR